MNIVVIGLYKPGTGFTRVLNQLCNCFSSFSGVHWIGIGYQNEPIALAKNITLYPSNLKGGDIYGAYQALELLEEVGGKILFLLNDIYILKNYLICKLNKQWRIVAYTPLDGYIKSADYIDQLYFIDDLVLYSEWAKIELSDAIKKYQSEYLFPNRLYSIPHGIDSEHFYPIQNTKVKVLKAKIFGENASEHLFILNANRFNERKDLPSTIEAYSIAKNSFNIPVKLCLHCPGLHETQQSSLNGLIEKFDLADDCIVNPLGDQFVGNRELNELYNACEIGINTSMGEGWGLVSFEHAACAKSQIVPDHSSPGILWKDIGWLIKVSSPVQLTTNPFEMRKVDVSSAAMAMIALVNNSEKRNDISQRCFSFSRKKKFKWENICQVWKELLLK